MRKLRLISLIFIFLFNLDLYSQCEYQIEFNKKKYELDSSKLFFRGDYKYYIISLSYYENTILNNPSLKYAFENKLLFGKIDTTYNISNDIEFITITYKLKKKKKYKKKLIEIISKDLCTNNLIIPLYDYYDFIDINLKNKYIIYRNTISIIE